MFEEQRWFEFREKCVFCVLTDITNDPSNPTLGHSGGYADNYVLCSIFLQTFYIFASGNMM